MARAHIQIENHFSIILVRPLTERARRWLVKHTDGTWFGGALAVEPRYVEDLADGMRGAGLVLEGLGFR